MKPHFFEYRLTTEIWIRTTYAGGLKFSEILTTPRKATSLTQYVRSIYDTVKEHAQ